jgi:hypothetical protein
LKITDLYSPFINSFLITKNIGTSLTDVADLAELHKLAIDWELDLENAQRWMLSPEYKTQLELARRFINLAPTTIEKVEKVFGHKLVGEVRLSPSLMRFDGFARYDSGSHVVWFGLDHPDADDDYLKVLMTHELSHVYRDHQPSVWGFLKKPLVEISRQEYLDNASALEHLASEGLATLFSQLVYPKVPLHVHHYYLPHEMQWCLENESKIEAAILGCLKGDENVWSFYSDDRVAPGSPSRTQYFWAARKIGAWLLEQAKGDSGVYQNLLLSWHAQAASNFDCLKASD